MGQSKEITITKDIDDCPVKKAMNIIGGKWKIFIICVLLENQYVRYGEIKRNVKGITDMMLSQCLKELEKDNVVNRIQFNEIPLRVEYTLTENGKKLINVMEQLSLWGKMQ